MFVKRPTIHCYCCTAVLILIESVVSTGCRRFLHFNFYFQNSINLITYCSHSLHDWACLNYTNRQFYEMVVPETHRITGLYIELEKQLQSRDYEKATKTCNRLLHETPTDILAFECKIICCVNLSRFQEALDFAKKNPSLIENLNYELAYCHYRLDQTNDALKFLDNITDSNDLRKKELYCQILYRLENYSECYELYREVCKTAEDEYDDDRLTNMTAIAASLRFANNNRKLTVERGNTFEQLYNYACYQVSEGNYDEAENILEEAEKVADETLHEEEMAEEDIQDEICIIKALRAYCYQIRGREKDATYLRSIILKQKPSSEAVLAVVSNNVIVHNRDQNIFDSKKRVRAMNVDNLGYKLTSAQKLIIQQNLCLFYLVTHQDELCEQLYSKLLSGIGKTSEDIICLAEYHKYRSKREIDILGNNFPTEVKKNKNLHFRMRLGLMKTALQSGDIDNAVASASQLGKEHGFPLGLISTLVMILRHYKTNEAVTEAFSSALNHFKESNSDSRSVLLKQAAAFQIEIDDYKQAEIFLKELFKIQPNDILGTALLLTVYVHLQEKKLIAGLAEKLPDPARGDFDLDSLESDTLQGTIRYIKKSVKIESQPMSPETSANTSTVLKKKKKKKRKLPKNHDPYRNIDPERWLPRYERTGYKVKKSRRGRADVGKGTQGAASDASEALDMSRGSAGNKSKITTPVSGKKQALRKPKS